MRPLVIRATMLCALLAASCRGDGAADEKTDDPQQPGLAFAMLPADVPLDGLFLVRVRLNDRDGHMLRDSQTMITIRASGTGTLSGTLTRRAIQGQAVFDDLVYDHWENIQLTISASGFADTSTRKPLPVRPWMRFVTVPPDHVPVGEPIGPTEIELVDGRGRPVLADQPVTLEAAGGVSAADGVERRFTSGAVKYQQISFGVSGSRSLVWQSPGLASLIHGVTVHDGTRAQSLWLPAGRVGAPYRAQVPGGASEYRLLKESLAHGLKLEPNGEIHGVPAVPGDTPVEIFAVEPDGRSTIWKADLPIFPAQESTGASLDLLDVDGPFMISSIDDVVAVPSRHATVRTRTFFPAASERPMPVVVFHHGALEVSAEHPTAFDRYDHLLRRWASHGYVVCSIDAPELVWLDGRLVGASLANLNAMSEDQRATIAHLRQRNAEPSFPIAGKMNVERIIVAGHSRGGGASLITARIEPSVVGGILLKPLDPMVVAGGETLWNTSLPTKPFLMVIAGADGDLPYPMVDYLYERRAGPIVAPTILGSLHSFSCDESCPPDPTTNPAITRGQDWSITNAYAVAFLKYAADGDLSVGPLLFGREGLTTHLSPLGTLVQSDRGGTPLIVDDFQQGTPGRNALGLASTDEQMTWSVDRPSMISAADLLPNTYDSFRVLYETPERLHPSNAHFLAWVQDDARYIMMLGGLDIRPFAAFVFRARSEGEPIDGARLRIRFRDQAGNMALVEGAEYVGANGIGARFSNVIVPIGDIRQTDLDLSQLATVELVFAGSGAVTIDDLRFE